ncbi:hypothetical protein KVC54_03145 [Helicobacter pylori]|nr:hypothetical protein KVC54_03145 [Helicobacter pylori]
MDMLDIMFDQVLQCFRENKNSDAKERSAACLSQYDKEVVDFILAVSDAFRICSPMQEKGKLEPYTACLIKHANKTPETLQYVKRSIKQLLPKNQKERNKK